MGSPSRALEVGSPQHLARRTSCFILPLTSDDPPREGRCRWPQPGHAAKLWPSDSRRSAPGFGPLGASVRLGLQTLRGSASCGALGTGLPSRDSEGRQLPRAALVREFRRKVAPLSELSASAARQTAPTAAPPAIGRFGAAHRLVAKREFTAALRTGRRLRGDHVQLIAAPRRGQVGQPAEELPVLPSRLGLSVSKGVGNSPQRARLRRLLREAFRGLRGRLKGSCDVVVIAKTPWPNAALADVSAEMAALLSRLRLVAHVARPAGEMP